MLPGDPRRRMVPGLCFELIVAKTEGVRERGNKRVWSAATTLWERLESRARWPATGRFEESSVSGLRLPVSSLSAEPPVLPSSFPLFAPAMSQVGLVIPVVMVAHDLENLGFGSVGLLQDRRHQPVCLGQGQRRSFF